MQQREHELVADTRLIDTNLIDTEEEAVVMDKYWLWN